MWNSGRWWIVGFHIAGVAVLEPTAIGRSLLKVASHPERQLTLQRELQEHITE